MNEQDNTDGIYLSDSPKLESFITFRGASEKPVGELHLGPPMRFEGDADASARIFFDCVIALQDAEKQRLVKERDDMLEDKERLDWLEKELEFEQDFIKRGVEYPRSLYRRNVPITREAIDDARALKP